ncbi:hypothetical protein [Staphylococcus pseudintermedius]
MVQKIHYHQQQHASQDDALLAAFNDDRKIYEVAQPDTISVY